MVLNIKNGDLDGLKQELLGIYGTETKINYNNYLKDGWTLLLHAVSNLQYDIVKHLIHKDANVNIEAGMISRQLKKIKF